MTHVALAAECGWLCKRNHSFKQSVRTRVTRGEWARLTSNSLPPYRPRMGLGSVELVMEVEDRFKVKLPGVKFQRAPQEIQRAYVGKRVPDAYRKRGAANPIKYAEKV